jgi:hypothetical protein
MKTQKSSSKSAPEVLGFGFDPTQNQHHFAVIIPHSQKGQVLVHECMTHDPDKTEEAYHMEFIGGDRTGKVKLERTQWDRISDYLKVEFNQRLKRKNPRHRKVKWQRGINLVHRLFGKELMVLAWAIEEEGPNRIDVAVENWLGLKPEERWWLYTVTNAATGHPTEGRGIGWRKALRFALTENPVQEGRFTQELLDEHKQTLFEEEQDYKPNKEA